MPKEIYGPFLPVDHTTTPFIEYKIPRCGYCHGSGLANAYYEPTEPDVSSICTAGVCGICPCGVGFFHRLGPRENLEKICGVCKFTYKVDLRTAKEILRIPRTQKALGVRALSQYGFHFVGVASSVFQNSSHVDSIGSYGLEKMFIRPCPSKPRHGFLESRTCKTKEEIQQLLKETLALDPDGELLFMEKIEAKASAVFVAESGALALGPSNDGATSGHKSIMLPCIPVTLGQISEFRKSAGIAENEHTYLELLYKKQYDPVARALGVQARSGPPIKSTSPDFIPRTEKVKKVIKPGKDLLAWEKLVKEMEGVEGVAAYQKGATLACHAAVHCIAANIPFITTKCPRKGTLLTASESYNEFDKEEFIAGMNIGWHGGINALYGSIKTAIAIVHNIGALKTSPHYSRLLGYAASSIFKAGALACVGESRHREKISQVIKGTRVITWRKYDKHSPRWLAQKCGRLVPIFLDQSWDSAYGGIKWADCCLSVVSLYQSMTACNIAEVIQKMNVVITTCHNGGKLLSKFVYGGMFLDEAAKAPGPALAQCGGDLYRVLHRPKPKAKFEVRPYVKRAHIFNTEPVTYQGDVYGFIRLKFTIPSKKIPKKQSWILTDPVVWKESSRMYHTVNQFLNII